MALSVHNTLSKSKEPFEPADPKVVRIYTCGLTVYAAMHIGHARTYCFWDAFRRYLEYRGYHVVSVINYTDIDDRIIALSGEREGPVDLAERNIAGFRADCRKLHIKDYAAYTRATDFIDEQVEMIDGLLDKGHAYAREGEVLYEVTTYEPYGQLSGNRLDAQQVGASGRVTEDTGRKRHPADFTLWKPTDPGEPNWPSGHNHWPDGRPGWHIECSAMSTALLGPHFDVHGGAIDNLFPHHENEIAQSEPLCGRPWVRYWLHPEHLDLIDEKTGKYVKMSKSLGNVIGIDELLGKLSHDEVRWFFATQHYRSKLPFNWELCASGTQGYVRIKKLISVLADKLLADPSVVSGAIALPTGLYASQRPEAQRVPRLRHQYLTGQYRAQSEAFITRFIEAMDDDLNTPNAIAALFDYVSALYTGGIEQSTDSVSLLAVYRTLVRHLSVLGVEIADPKLYPQLIAEYARAPAEGGEGRGGDSVVDRLLAMRLDARKAKDFAKSDAIRNLLIEAGVLLEDTPSGPRWSKK
ncbi:MAG: High confidence in function and specificity [Pseudomonadota bacterium]|jgi:cysteinyl-tRNA synthetase